MKKEKINALYQEIKIKDQIIFALFHACAENKVSLPNDVISVIETLYIKELQNAEKKVNSGKEKTN